MTIKLNLDDFKKEISLTKKKDENLIDLKDFEYISYTNNNEVDDFLNEKSFMLINFIGKSNIFLGNIFLEVQNYLNNALTLKKDEEEVEIIEVDNLDLENRVRKLSISFENLEPKKQKQVDSLLKKIERIMSS